jgi:NAD(P)-dependent dehydrogenase (short-subunit alcohol dehydrogenase family)
MEKSIVLVTGASSGIGRECALSCAAAGLTVFAGVRRTEDGEALRAASRGALTPVIVDITNADSIESAVRVIRGTAGTGDTVNLVNNAGITVAGPLELLETDDLRRQFEVNVFGHVAMTRALLPLVRRQGGRIVMMGSLFGRIALPYVAPYAAAKFALAAISDSLSIELRPWKIPVILVEPGNIATPIWSRTKADTETTMDKLSDEAWELYRPGLESFEKLTDAYAKSGIPAARVARVVVRALTSRRPRRRYPVGADACVYGRLAPLLPARVRQWVLWRMTSRR